MSARGWLLLACCALIFSACSFRDRHEACDGPSDCPVGKDCFQGFCVRADEASERNSRIDGVVSSVNSQHASAAVGGAGTSASTSKASASAGARSAPPPSSQASNAGMSGGGRPARSEATDHAADGGVSSAHDDAGVPADKPLGPCTDQVAPSAELCNGIDDDCDGEVDNGYDLRRDQNNCGQCGNKCADGELCRMGTCAAPIMDPTEPAPNEPTGCKPACGAGQTCCGSACIDSGSDIHNCGACGNACAGATQPGCCNGRCVDLVSEQHCGRCGRDCSLLSNGGITCSCRVSGNGEIACSGPVLNLCL